MCAILVAGCTSQDEVGSKRADARHAKGEYIYRKHNELFFNIPAPEKTAATTYPWNEKKTSIYPTITKEFFRCQGNAQNPRRTLLQSGEDKYFFDCNGLEKHGLPLRGGKEFIYPILIDLVNYVQDSTQKKVIITSGHRCPEHNSYIDPSPSNQYSKHMIGAEVSFYVQGMEMQPEQIAALIQKFYTQDPRYRKQKEYEVFQRYDKGNTNVGTLPWFNKEIFIKIFTKTEGRNFDNRHPYPYISIQVRYDRDLNENVVYSWDKAFRNFHRK